MNLGLHPKNRYEINRGRGPNCDRRPNGAMVCVNVCLSAGCVCICGHTLVHLSPIWAATITAGIDGDDGNVNGDGEQHKNRMEGTGTVGGRQV